MVQDSNNTEEDIVLQGQLKNNMYLDTEFYLVLKMNKLKVPTWVIVTYDRLYFSLQS